MIERSVCIVPGCCNSSARWANFEYICSRHWRMIPKRLKRHRAKMARLLKGRRELVITKDAYEPKSYRARVIMERCWLRLKAAAIEGSGGL